MTPLATSTRARVLAAIILLVTFVAGAAVGWGATQWAHHRAGAHRGAHGGLGGPHRGEPPFLRELDLTPTQRVRVDSILEHHRAQMDSFWHGPGRQLRAIVDSTSTEIRTVLTPAQQQAFDRMRARHAAERRP